MVICSGLAILAKAKVTQAKLPNFLLHKPEFGFTRGLPQLLLPTYGSDLLGIHAPLTKSNLIPALTESRKRGIRENGIMVVG